MYRGVFATITLEMSKAGIRAYCEELEEDVFCIDGDLDPLLKLINDADAICNPDAVFSLAPEEEEIE